MIDKIKRTHQPFRTRTGGDDLFVEVGDRVTYCPADDPANRHSVLIVDSESNVKMGLVNESASLAQVLLGLSPGDEGELEITGQRSRRIRVIKVQRQEEFLA